jgi:hypothetical protein
MKTLNSKSKNNKTSIIVCIILLAIHSSAFSQNKLLTLASSINLHFALPIIGVLGLFTFLLFAFMKQKNH